MDTKEAEKLSEEAFKELFDSVDVWAKKYEEKGLNFQGIVNFFTFDSDGDYVAGQWSSNIDSMEIFNTMHEDIIKELEMDSENVRTIN